MCLNCSPQEVVQRGHESGAGEHRHPLNAARKRQKGGQAVVDPVRYS